MFLLGETREDVMKRISRGSIAAVTTLALAWLVTPVPTVAQNV